MVDSVRMSLGLSPEAKAQRVRDTNYNKGTPASTVMAEPTAPAPKVGFVPQAPTGVVPKSTQELAADNYIAPVKATKLETAGAAMGGVAIDVFRGARSALIYDTDPDFNHKPLSDEFFTKFGAGTPLEVKYLSSAKSYQDWQDRQGYIQDNRMREQAIADNPWTGAAASIVDADLALSIVPIVGAGSKAARAAGASTKVRNATRAAAGATAAGALVATQSMLGDSTLRSEGTQMVDATVFGLARALAPLSKAAVAASATDNAAVRAVQGAADDAGTTVPEVHTTPIQDAVVDTTVLQTPKEEALAAANTVGLTREQIMKLPQNKQRAAWIKQNTQRRNAVAEVEAKYTAAEEAAIKATDAAGAARIAREVEEDLAVIQERARTESPPQAVARNKWIAKLQSTADELNYLTKGDTNTVVNKLLSNPAINNGDDVVSAQNVYINNYSHKLMGVEDALKDAVAVHTKGHKFARFTGKYAEATKAVSADFQEAMQRLDSQVLEYNRANGAVPSREVLDQMITQTGHHPSMQKLMREYIDSDFAVQVYDDAHARGWVMREVVQDDGTVKLVNGFDDIVRRPTYMPLRHSYDKIENTVRIGKASMDEIADFIGAQIARMYPDLLNPKGASGKFVLTERQVGQHFLQTQEAKRGLSDVTATGMNKEEIASILTRTGEFTDKDAAITAAKIFDNMHKKGTSVPKNLRRRIDWDWGAKLRTSSGEDLTMRDLVDDSVMGNLEDYSRGMAHRNGLADYGIMSEAELDSLLTSYLSKLPEDANVQQARQFMKNAKNVLIGRAIDDNPVPQGVRSAQAVADLFLLANSGLYTFIDIATQMQKVGVARSLPAMKQGMRNTFTNLRELNHTQAKSLEDILSGRLLATSRFKNFTVRYADNFEVSGGIHEAAQYYGQSARFMNLSESLKRFQVGVLASVYVDNLKGAMKGSAKELEFMKDKLKISDDLIGKIQQEYAQHGAKIDDWSNGVRVKYEQAVFSDADNLAMNVHRGEVPAILEHSQVGRVIFPYMTYAFGMQNKVLRRSLNRDGYAGLAMLMAVQIPTAMLIGAAINIRKGEEYDKDLMEITVRSMSALGSLNYPLEIAMAGLNGGGVTAIAPFSKTYNFGKEVFTGGSDDEVSLRQLKTNSPLNAAVPLDLLLLALEDD